MPKGLRREVLSLPHNYVFLHKSFYGGCRKGTVTGSHANPMLELVCLIPCAVCHEGHPHDRGQVCSGLPTQASAEGPAPGTGLRVSRFQMHNTGAVLRGVLFCLKCGVVWNACWCQSLVADDPYASMHAPWVEGVSALAISYAVPVCAAQ